MSGERITGPQHLFSCHEESVLGSEATLASGAGLLSPLCGDCSLPLPQDRGAEAPSPISLPSSLWGTLGASALFVLGSHPRSGTG